jgi:CheY-like chemotaxis protein
MARQLADGDAAFLSTPPAERGALRLALAIPGQRLSVHRLHGRLAGGLIHALEKIREHSYDLVICDTRMLALDGPGLYRQVEQSRPELRKRWIFLTGDALDPETTAFLEGVRTPTLTKPFGPDDLRRVVAQVGARV